jgi:uncharacterized membrane protein
MTKKEQKAVKKTGSAENSINAALRKFIALFDAGEGAHYSLNSSLLIIFLSSLALSYYIYALIAGNFDIIDFIGKNTRIMFPGLLAGMIAAVTAVFTAILCIDKKRKSVLIHHIFSFLMLSYFFIRINKNGWAEYENPLMIAAQCLCLALYFGFLLEKLFSLNKKTGMFMENRSIYFLAVFLAVYLVYFCRLALERHYMFYSQTYDLAWEHQVLHTLARTGFPYSTIASIPGMINWGDHSSFIYYLLAPFYLLYPRVEFMLVFQVLSVTAAGYLVYLYTRDIFKNGFFSVVFAVAFLMHPSVQGYLIEDFHPSVIALPVFFAFLIFAEKKNFAGTIISFFILSIVREDIAFFSIFAALYMTVSKKISLGRGITLGIISLAMIMLAMWVMKISGGGVYTESRFYTLDSGFKGVLEAAVANPLYIFSRAFDPDKINFFIIISAPLLFLFIFDGPAWIMLIPASIFGVFSNYLPHYIMGYHYTVMFICAAFAGAAAYLRGRKIPVLMAGAILAMAFFMNYYYGNIFPKSYRLVCTEVMLAKDKPDYIYKGWVGLYRELRGEKDPEAEGIMRSIPEDYRVSAEYFAAPHVSGRRYIYPLQGYRDSDVVINRRGAPAFAGYVLLKSTVLWDFYAKSSIVSGQKAGTGPDEKIFFRKLN